MDNLARLKNILDSSLEIASKVARLAVNTYQKAWLWLHTRVPILGALVRRHVKNPSTVFIDAAIAVLVAYIIFGVVGFVQIYPKKAETPLANNLSELYPFPAAKVDATLVWSHEFLVRLKFLNTFSSQAPSDASSKPPTDKELRSRVLEGLIEDRVIYLEAKRLHISVTSAELSDAFAKQGKPDEVAAKIKQLYGMTLVEFKQILAEQLLREKVKNVVLARTKIRHILTLDLPSAQQAKKEISGGKDFADVVKEFSQDSKSVPNGGDLGYWRKGELAAQVSPSVEDAVAKLAVNQVSDPIQTQFGFQIIQVTDRTSGADQTYDEWYKDTLAKHSVRRWIKI